MARTLQQIITELNPAYQPQINTLRQRQALIPGQTVAEEKGLQAKQESAFGDILGGARRRGLGFSGIPLEEQAKYTSTEFLPAVARLKQQSKDQAFSLEDAILGISERRNTLAQQLRQQEQDRDFQREQFEEQKRAAARAEALAAQATLGSLGSFGGGGGGEGGAPATTNNNPNNFPRNQYTQGAYNDVTQRVSLLSQGKASPSDLIADYIETRLSADRGNQRDRQKLIAYSGAFKRLLPQWYGNQAIVRGITDRFKTYDATRRGIVSGLGRTYGSTGGTGIPLSALTGQRLSF